MTYLLTFSALLFVVILIVIAANSGTKRPSRSSNSNARVSITRKDAISGKNENIALDDDMTAMMNGGMGNDAFGGHMYKMGDDD